MSKKEPTFRENPANSIFYNSEFFRSKDEQRNNFAFCQVYFITDEHGRWTRNLDIIWEKYVEKHRLIKGIDGGLYSYYLSLANRRVRLSNEGIAEFMGVSKTTILECQDRLQDAGLAHRVCRADAHGAGHDIIIHSPCTPEQLKIYLPTLQQRAKLEFTKNNRQKRLEERTFTINKGEKAGQTETKLMRNRETCCPEHLRLDLREIRMMFHTGQTKEQAGGKIPRKYWKPEWQTNKFLTACLDALRELHRLGIRPNADPSQTEVRTENWKTFKTIFRKFCEDDRIGIGLNASRWKAAWRLVNYYSPNVFYYVEI